MNQRLVDNIKKARKAYFWGCVHMFNPFMVFTPYFLKAYAHQRGIHKGMCIWSGLEISDLEGEVEFDKFMRHHVPFIQDTDSGGYFYKPYEDNGSWKQKFTALHKRYKLLRVAHQIAINQ